MSQKRPGTNADRDIYTPKTPAKGHAVPVAIEEEEVTGKHDGDELAMLRAKRPTHDRIARLEVKSDDAAKSNARVEGKLDAVLVLLTGKATEDGKTNRIRITSNGKVTIAIAIAAIGAIVTVLTKVLH
jgi:hypothetical protein